MQESSHCDQYNHEYGPLDIHVLTVSASCLRCIGLMFSDEHHHTQLYLCTRISGLVSPLVAPE